MASISCTGDILALGVQRVGFMSGSFDPPHDSHLAVMEQVLLDGQVDHVMVCAHSCNPEKIERLTPIEHRLAMLQALISSSNLADRISTCDPSAIHGIENLTFLQSVERLQNLGLEVWVVRGQDAIRDHYPDDLRKVPHIVIPRQGYENHPNEVLRGKFLMTRPIGKNSSTAVREQLKRGIPHPVPAVDRYIREKRLYSG